MCALWFFLGWRLAQRGLAGRVGVVRVFWFFPDWRPAQRGLASRVGVVSVVVLP